MILTSVRHYINENSTGGCTLLDSVKMWELQEDTARAAGCKVYGKTCIPPGNYQVSTRYSPSFEREMVVLYNQVSDGGVPTVRNGAFPFTYIYSHGGNDAGDSKGCLLHGYERTNRDEIFNTAEAEIFTLVKEAMERGEHITWEIVHDPENNYQLADLELFGKGA